MAQLAQNEISNAEIASALDEIAAEQEAWMKQVRSERRIKVKAEKMAAEKSLRTAIFIGKYLENSPPPNKAYTLWNPVVYPCFFKARATPSFLSGNVTRSGA